MEKTLETRYLHGAGLLLSKGKTVLVTGGTGSFGKALIRTLLDWTDSKVIVFSRCELKQFQFRQELGDNEQVRWFIGDVRDRERLYRALDGVDYVVHAAALKQVDTCEYNPIEARRTNIDGACNLIDAAIDRGVKRVIALSTDKAVHPVNNYGACKLVAEKMFTAGNSYAGRHPTRFACVRYGNVMGSRGSLIPKILEQRETGVVTLTDPRMSRFWMRLEDTVKFVLWSLADMQGGEIFVPFLKAAWVTDLIRLLAPDCKVEQIGIRPGEKLHEILIAEEEARTGIVHKDADGWPLRYILFPQFNSWGELTHKGEKLPEGFSFTSKRTLFWSDEELLKAIEELAA